jgi:homoserine O-acetyltransferase
MFRGGFYEPKPSGQPAAGLATARMIAMITYRSEASFDKRFGRKPSIQDKHLSHGPASACNKSSNQASVTSLITSQSASPTRWFSAQDYLHYQGLKFLRRFDANCYLHLINKMDLHDVTRGRVPEEIQSNFSDDVAAVLSRVPTRALVISIESDVLFLPGQQHHLVSCLKDATLVVLKSTDGHDGFLLEFEQLNNIITGRLRVQFSSIYERPTETAAKVDEAPLRNGVSVGEVD